MKNLLPFDYFEKALPHYEFFIENNLRLIPTVMSSNVALIIKTENYAWHLKILITNFSLGKPISEIKKILLQCIPHLIEVWNPEVVKMKVGNPPKQIDVYYLEYTIQMRWTLALCVLMDVEDSGFNKLVDLIKRDGIKDALYDFFIASRIENWEISEAVRPLKPSNSIKDIILETDKIKCQQMIKVYLEKEWFKTYKNYSFYNIHKQINNAPLGYIGYWAFEVAAIVKIKELDDSSFRDNNYYPDRFFLKNS